MTKDGNPIDPMIYIEIGDRIERSVCLKFCFGQADFAVVLHPCFKSPNDDNGYDISDYRDYVRSCLCGSFLEEGCV